MQGLDTQSKLRRIITRIPGSILRVPYGPFVTCPFDSAGVCSMGPCFVYGIQWVCIGVQMGPILGAHRKTLG